MKIQGKPERTITLSPEDGTVWVIDQKIIPFHCRKNKITAWEEMREAISDMTVRGAPLIGVSGAAGMALAAIEDPAEESLLKAAHSLKSSRPTAVNLKWAVDRVLDRLLKSGVENRQKAAWDEASQILEEDVEMCRKIGEHFAEIIERKFNETQRPVNVLTHCNAGWMATVDWGTALAGIYVAHRRGIPLHVYADETRPRLQGAITAWELKEEDVPVTLLADNSGGLLMRQGGIDLVVVGADRIAANGDTANKIGTYLKALAAMDNNIPFYVAAPYSTFDFSIAKGKDIPIEERDKNEVLEIRGFEEDGKLGKVRIFPTDVPVWNPGFDVTPARLITGFVTERGIFTSDEISQMKVEK